MKRLTIVALSILLFNLAAIPPGTANLLSTRNHDDHFIDDDPSQSHAYKWYLSQMLVYMKQMNDYLKQINDHLDSLDKNIAAVKEKLHAKASGE